MHQKKSKQNTCIKQFLLFYAIILIKFYNFVLYKNYIKLKTYRIRPDQKSKNKFESESSRILI